MSAVFDRCDADTVAVLNTGLAEARRYRHNWLGTEHILLAFLQHHDRLPEHVARLLPTDAVVRAAMLAELGGPPAADTELLATLGIDLDQVRSSVRASFGAEAIEELGRRRVHQPWQPWRRPSRRCMSVLGGNAISPAPRVKQALDNALRHAARLGRPSIDPRSLLLGMIEVDDAVSNRLLLGAGVAPDGLRAALRQTER